MEIRFGERIIILVFECVVELVFCFVLFVSLVLVFLSGLLSEGLRSRICICGSLFLKEKLKSSRNLNFYIFILYIPIKFSK